MGVGFAAKDFLSASLPKVKMFSFILDGDRMSIRIVDLHEAYASASQEDRIAMANLGAVCWCSAKSELFSHWEMTMSAEEAAKTERYRTEGRKAALDSVKTQLVQAEEATLRLAAAEAMVATLKESMEHEVANRVEKVVDGIRKDLQLEKVNELSILKERIAAAAAKEEYVAMVVEGHQHMKEKIRLLEEQVATYTATTTKSSHAIGKAGESTVLELCTSVVLQHFLYGTIEDMSTVGHSADFHLSVMSPVGKKVKILIDSKKYKDTVRTKEIHKLIADVDADEDASAALLISLDSPIATTKQFQIEKTPKRKTIMYLVMKDMSDELRGQVLLWAVRVISTVASEETDEGQQRLVDNIQLFLKEINMSVRDAEATVKACGKATESAKIVRDGLMKRLTDFRCGVLKESVEDDEDVEQVKQCVAKKADGKQCANRPIVGETTCKVHKK